MIISDLRKDLKLVQNDSDVRNIKDFFQGKALECDGFFVGDTEDGTINECYGFSGCVPLLWKQVTVIVCPCRFCKRENVPMSEKNPDLCVSCVEDLPF